jgi:hypothetical protein
MALIYDENRHPYLFVFMIGSTLAVSAGTWFFQHERQTRSQIIALLSGFMTVAIIGAISEALWDWHACYGFPEPPPAAWYVSALRMILIFAVWTAILFWPALIGLVRRSLSSEDIDNLRSSKNNLARHWAFKQEAIKPVGESMK